MTDTSLEGLTHLPDQVSFQTALERTTHLGIGAHPDDLEIMAYHGIEQCYQSAEKWFAGMTVTNGSGSSRTGPYADFTDAQMVEIRHKEQVAVADIGQYSFITQLGLTSADLKEADCSLHQQIASLLRMTKPEVLYLHQPLDKHPTHLHLLRHCLKALRSLSSEELPVQIYGCEVWRGLDWCPEPFKIALDVSTHPDLALELIRAHDSQISGGKRYDLATLGRRIANATYDDPRESDQSQSLIWAIDLKPLVLDHSLTLESYAESVLETFQAEVKAGLKEIG
ncbi:MAG: PIG-L family deacetylase [Verrucomicrobiota bacterium]